MSTRSLVVLLLVCGVLRASYSGERTADQSLTALSTSLPGLDLPSALFGRAGRPVSLGPTERVLAARPGVSLSRRAYGDTRAALITTTGVKELHPPTVCLGAAGHEVSRRTREQSRAGCLVRLDVHQPKEVGTARATFYYTFFNAGAVTCNFWVRAGRAAWATLSGAPVRWSMLQVMDRDPATARQAMVALLQELRSRD